MRLYERLMEEPGGVLDKCMLGGITPFCKELAKAQCFQLSEEIAVACSEVVQSRPSTLLSAIDMVRAPYQHTWVEYTPNQRTNIRDNHNLFPGKPKPTPKRVGALLMTNKQCTRGTMILAWWHNNDDVQVNPLGLIFDWDSSESEPVLKQYLSRMSYGDPKWIDSVVEGRRKAASTRMPDRWQSFIKDDKEWEANIALTMRGDVIPLEMFMPFIATYKLKPGAEWYDSFEDDLAGELPFVEAFLLLLNSKNSIITQVKDDFSKLNRARAKNKKPPLKEFINTRLRISKVVANRAKAAGMSHEAARLHLVRGHFKVRRSGVYWWSPHSRGRDSVLLRREYKVNK